MGLSEAAVPGSRAADRSHGVHGVVGVVGLGLIGGSLLRSLSAAGVEAIGWDIDPGTRAQARAAGLRVVETLSDLGDRRDHRTSGDDISSDRSLQQVSLVVLAVPLRAMQSTLTDLSKILGPQVTLTDVGSVKAPVRSLVTEAGLGAQYVGAHPMAGTEHAGFSASDVALLQGVTWAMTLDSTTASEHAAAVAALITGPMSGQVLTLDDDTHDAAVARISHLPHVLATELLAGVALSAQHVVAQQLAAGSFRDGTRVARSHPERSRAMVEANAHWTAQIVRQSASDLNRLADDLEAKRDTAWFFERAAAVEAHGSAGKADSDRTGNGGGHPAVNGDDAVQFVAFSPGWRETLVSAGRRGWVVTGVTDQGFTLSDARR